MTKCNGECLIQCDCECYDEKIDIYFDICVCGHRRHNGLCPSDCCNPIECRNFKFCDTILPEWVTFCHNGMCMNCADQMGKHTMTTIKENCPICYENEIMIKLPCDHLLCNDCWFKITTSETYKINKCPLCRESNSWEFN